ncbi:MAG TPA: 50S ribosomal protein L22 [Bacteroidetes bacterium]|nr:MAG: 50S ribosomal protein L22 [Ignavibacteria bacterium GWC2_56_12]HAV24135.1 50S ribosomal protein L22 [Bacteroidota bacterium]
MEARALNRYISTSPRKMRLVVDLIRGKAVEDALTILHFAPKHAAKTAEKVLRSAIANFQNKDEAGRVDTATLYVKEAYVNGGASMKRVMPAPMGRAFRIRKRSNHVTIIVGQRSIAVQQRKAAAPKEKAAVAVKSKESSVHPKQKSK